MGKDTTACLEMHTYLYKHAHLCQYVIWQQMFTKHFRTDYGMSPGSVYQGGMRAIEM